MSRPRLSYFWVALLAAPSLYTLSASSLQFGDFTPFSMGPDFWYMTLVLTGAVLYPFMEEIRDVVISMAVIMLIDVIFHAGAYTTVLWVIGGYPLARIGMYTMIQPSILYAFIAILFLMVGFVAAALGGRVWAFISHG